jgi:uncharacterized protein (DUF2336 family)
MSDPSGFDRLADLALRRDADIRPTLLRVLTDLYMQRLAHSREEEQRYAELALPLLKAVDHPTRAEIGRRLSRHLSPPALVMAFLAGDTGAAATPLAAPTATATGSESGEAAPASTAAFNGDQALAADLNEQFFAANSDARRLILRIVPLVAPVADGDVARQPEPAITEQLEAAALSRDNKQFARILALALRISPDQARRIARDDLGEPLLVAARTLGIKRDMLYRMLMFINPNIGHSVERVHALTALYDEIDVRTADDIVSIWQALPVPALPIPVASEPASSRAAPAGIRSRSGYQPVTWDDVRRRARPEPASPRLSPGQGSKDRRTGS